MNSQYLLAFREFSTWKMILLNFYLSKGDARVMMMNFDFIKWKVTTKSKTKISGWLILAFSHFDLILSQSKCQNKSCMNNNFHLHAVKNFSNIWRSLEKMYKHFHIVTSYKSSLNSLTEVSPLLSYSRYAQEEKIC